ncbi:MAG: prepilin-type N-terminal cleavage/methylation domain-containing protein [Armatimonadota bacterium]
MNNRKGLTLIEIMVSMALVMVIGTFIAVIVVMGIRNYQRNEVKINLTHEARNVLQKLASDFRTTERSDDNWTDLIKDTPVSLTPASGSFYITRKKPDNTAEKITYKINAEGVLLRNDENIAGNVQKLTVTLKEKSSASIVENAFDISVEFMKNNVPFLVCERVEKRSAKLIAAAEPPAVPPAPKPEFMYYILIADAILPPGYWTAPGPSHLPMAVPGVFMNIVKVTGERPYNISQATNISAEGRVSIPVPYGPSPGLINNLKNQIISGYGGSRYYGGIMYIDWNKKITYHSY